jgi:MYXO-CTERM domain-containing protein
LRGLIAAAFLLGAPPAWATYSIVAAERTTGQVGGAVTSCVGTVDVSAVYGSAPGQGAIHAQAALNTAARDEGARLLALGTAPADIIVAITAPAFDSRASARQYGIVDLEGRSAGWTGSSAQDYKDDRQGSIDSFTYSVQGNILTSARVLDQAEAGFRAVACDLPERLMRALELGAANDEGDSRCTETRGIPSDAASIQVDLPGMPAGSYLRLGVRDTGSTNPLVLLRVMLEDWRIAHPCPAPDGGDPGGCACVVTAARAPTAMTLGAAMAAVVVARRRRRR